LRNYLLSGGNVKVTARQLKISKNTVKEYVRRAEGYSSDLSRVLELDDETFGQVMYAEAGRKADSRLRVLEEQADYWLKELQRVGVTRELLWQEYRQAYPDGYGYSQFCEHLRQQVRWRDLTIALEHKGGEVLMADFTGKKIAWVDPHTGEEHLCEVFVVVMPFSHYCFCM
jgi:transposase